MSLLIVAYSLNEIPGLAGAPPACKKLDTVVYRDGSRIRVSVSDRKVTPN